MFTTMRSEELPAADRFPWWCEQMARDVSPTAFTSPHAADFRAGVTLAELGPVLVSRIYLLEARARRTPTLVRRSDPERYGLCLVTANDMYFTQRGRECRVGAGDLLLYDTSQPYDSGCLPAPGPGGMLILQLPKAALPLRAQRLDAVVARRLPGNSGMTAILARYLASVAAAAEKSEVSEQEARTLGEVALDLAATSLAAYVDADDQLGPETRQRALLARIDTFIERNLGDPNLTPSVIAAHQHISLSYLHRLFQDRELTISAWIRRLRLERARADLAEPRLSHRPLHAIAARWGFRHAADFSRAFRAAYGMPPSDYRHQALRRE